MHPLHPSILIAIFCSLPLIAAQAQATPLVESEAISQWKQLAPGLEQRVYLPSTPYAGVSLMVVRIDPAYYSFRVHYRPGERLSSGDWWQNTLGAAVFVNANFFDLSAKSSGLLVADQQVFGESYEGYGGTFAIVSGQPVLWPNTAITYTGGELQQAIQAYPMLVIDGEAAFQEFSDNEQARRTVIGQDRQGRILLMVTPLGGISLRALSTYLPTTDLDLVTALNLDGGVSTMMYIAPQEETAPYLLRALEPIPAVLAVYPRPDFAIPPD